MAEKTYLTETVKYHTEVFRPVWIFILAIGGGSLGLLLGEPTGTRVILAVAGLVSVGLLLEVLRRLSKQIGRHVKRMLEVKDA